MQKIFRAFTVEFKSNKQLLSILKRQRLSFSIKSKQNETYRKESVTEIGDCLVPVERIYQKKTQVEHILMRPDTYIGSIEPLTQEMWIWDLEADKMTKKEITYVPGLYKIFDEILVNAADNKRRDPSMSLIRINIDKVTNSIKIYNNGKGIPVVEHKDEKVYVPTLIFGHLLTSSNYNDDERKVTGYWRRPNDFNYHSSKHQICL
jgi:hypothetical protein